ncbi:MAG: hypothetical protein FJ395_00200 [Verrucomicrobia bacterium]|nr:hypothetical protein [Verrucomicrobiota bacterium]
MNPPDHNERRKITAQLDTTMIVEAAAGTGKTTAMVNRIVALVNAGKCSADTLAAVTFTRKAAAELRERLREKLPQAAQCQISTVHSFCGRLLRERPVEAGVDPDFEELDDERDGRLRHQAWENFTNELFAKDDSLLNELDELGIPLADLWPAFQRFANYPDVHDWPAPEVPAPALMPAVAALREYAAHMEKNLPDPNGTDELAGLFRRVLRMLRSHDLARRSEVAEILEQFKPGRKCTHKYWPNGKEQALREHEQWDKFCDDVAGPFVTAWRAHRYPSVLRVLQGVRAVYDRQREAAHGLNFQDLLLLAAKLLRERPEVRQYFRRRFTHVLVDEFQDTDPVQAEVMLLLTAENLRERDWRKCRPAPGSLFVVGDPKQSIYRFRRADIVTYNTVKQIIQDTGGAVVTLSANFRSARPVVDWVNAVFGGGKFFPAAANEVAPGYVPFLVGREEQPADAAVFQVKVTGDNQSDIAVAEADFIARHIRASGRTPGDFLIVTRRKDRLSVYADALQQLGLPHEVTGGSSLNEVRELGLWHAALRAALEPDNPVAVVAALRSELFGFSDEELYAHRRAGGRFDWRSDATGPMGEAFAVLRRFAEWLGSLAPVIAVERVANDLGLLPLAAGAPGGDVEAGSLGKALELLRAGQADWPTAAAMVEQLGRWATADEPHDGASATAPTGAAVRVMNLHKVKGLQAPVVFLADPAGASEHEVELHVDRRGARVTGHLALYGATNAFGRGSLLAHPLDWEKLAAREAQFRQAEENRLLYVAATRARDQLIVSLRDKRAASNPWNPLEPALKDAAALPDPGPQSAPVTKPVTLTGADVAAARAAIAARWETIKTPTYATRAAKPATAAVMARTDGDGMRWGSVIHLLLQTAMREPAGDLHAAAVSALRAAELDVALAGEAVAVAGKVVKSELWQRAQKAQRRLAEAPVVVALADGLVRGVIDLAFEEADGWVLVDYKTDRMERPETLLEQYRVQLESYRTCWQAATGQAVKELGLYAVTADRYLVLK